MRAKGIPFLKISGAQFSYDHEMIAFLNKYYGDVINLENRFVDQVGILIFVMQIRLRL